MIPSKNEGDHGCAVSIREVAKSYGLVEAVRGVCLDIRPGEFLTLLGPSGSGKTTLLMILAGFIAPTSGSIAINGVPVTDLPPHRRNIGMVFQSYALFPHMNVFKNVAFPLEARRLAKDEIKLLVHRALALVQLKELADRYPSELSGGQQQRVALARAIVFNPPLLLMDEPLGALDKNLREHMQIELLNIKNTLQRTVVYVTHDQEEALVMSDRIVVMADGCVQQVGTAEDLYERPANHFVAKFIGVANMIEGQLQQKDNRWYVRLPDGIDIAAPPSARQSSGSPASIVIRPERIDLGPSARRSGNSFSGRITQLIYLGETTRVSVVVGENLMLVAKVQNRSGRPKFSVGDTIDVGWEAEMSWLV